MPRIHDALAEAGRKRLAAFAGRDAVLAFDFDGTLAPIRRDPRRVLLSARTRDALARLCARAPCVVLSGRARADVARRVRGLDFAAISGDHGHDLDPPSVRERDRLERYERRLSPIVRALRGTRLERKAHTIAVHWRTATDPELARACILREATRLAPSRLLVGKCVVELHASSDDHKGTALARICRALRRTRALYVGDDTTDEDVFLRSGKVDVLGIHVGEGPTAAALRIDRQSQVVVLLEFLASTFAQRP